MIEVSSAGHVARLTLNAPERHNALTRSAMDDFIAALDDLETKPDLRCLIVTGTGKSFCSGASLADVAESDFTDNPLTVLCDRIEECSLPTICAFNGPVFGGGVEVALACDFRIGRQGMRAMIPPAKLGIHYPVEGIARAVHCIGLQATRRMFLLAETFSDQMLLDAGFVDELVPPDQVEIRAASLSEQLCNLAPLAVQGMKRSIVEVMNCTVDRDATRARVAACFASDDHKEGLAAKKEKRTPVFNNR